MYVSQLSAQKTNTHTWHNTLETLNKLAGQDWEDIGYNRFPDTAESKVREYVWLLYRQAAGLSIRFTTDADSFQIRYEVDGNIAMNYMPGIGVSEIDLYGKTAVGNWLRHRRKAALKIPRNSNTKQKTAQKETGNISCIFPYTTIVKTQKWAFQKGAALDFSRNIKINS